MIAVIVSVDARTSALARSTDRAKEPAQETRWRITAFQKVLHSFCHMTILAKSTLPGYCSPDDAARVSFSLFGLNKIASKRKPTIMPLNRHDRI